jgi:molybdopterin-containing oxidoreductase family iron-sulfur binding subunit
LNAQVYNRCVGTRYCANNCPYTVRFFNFYDPVWPEPLGKALNPEVSIRSKGVMEKCTFCIQRIRKGEERARDEGREVRDGDVVPACVQSCTTKAMTFGNIADEKSEVARLAKSNRATRLLEDLGTKPRVVYLRKGD